MQVVLPPIKTRLSESGDHCCPGTIVAPADASLGRIGNFFYLARSLVGRGYSVLGSREIILNLSLCDTADGYVAQIPSGWSIASGKPGLSKLSLRSLHHQSHPYPSPTWIVRRLLLALPSIFFWT
jgi:hypothetical protein